MDLRVRVVGGVDETELKSLYDWLRRDEDLPSSRIRWAETRPGAEEMGALSDALVVSLGTGGAGVALVQSLATWLRTRGTDVRLRIHGPYGEIDVDAKRLRDPEAFVARFQSIMRD
jgi:hypothetical protein